MGILEDLLANPGKYLFLAREPEGGDPAAPRIVVTPLPGGAGVTIGYETFNPASPERIQGHAERTVMARTAGGEVMMVVGHSHADSVAILREAEPGVFLAGPGDSSFPVSISDFHARAWPSDPLLVVWPAGRGANRTGRSRPAPQLLSPISAGLHVGAS